VVPRCRILRPVDGLWYSPKHMRRLLGFIVFFVACTNAGIEPAVTQLSESDVCVLAAAPCVIELTEPSVLGQPVLATYRLCCPAGASIEMGILEVSGNEGNWADVTRWSLCGHDYTEEFVHPHRLAATPWAILSTFDGNGGDITSCRTANAPLD
jgi:hypothetical protein